MQVPDGQVKPLEPPRPEKFPDKSVHSQMQVKRFPLKVTQKSHTEVNINTAARDRKKDLQIKQITQNMTSEKTDIHINKASLM